MNIISLFGPATTPGAWLEVLLGLSALSMATTLPDLRRQSRSPRAVPLWLPVGGLLGLAAASMIADVVQAELLAAAFGEF